MMHVDALNYLKTSLACLSLQEWNEIADHHTVSRVHAGFWLNLAKDAIQMLLCDQETLHRMTMLAKGTACCQAPNS